MPHKRANPNPPAHCKQCARPFGAGNGLQRTCSTTCEVLWRQRAYKALDAAKARRATA